MEFAAYAALYLTAALFGAMVFFSAVVAPLVFKLLAEAEAGVFLRGLFPRYYRFMELSAGLGAVAASFAGAPGAAVALAGVAGTTLLVRLLLVPRINGWRDAELAGNAAAAKRFAAGHRASVAVNLVQLVVVIWCLGELLG